MPLNYFTAVLFYFIILFYFIRLAFLFSFCLYITCNSTSVSSEETEAERKAQLTRARRNRYLKIGIGTVIGGTLIGKTFSRIPMVTFLDSSYSNLNDKVQLTDFDFFDF